MNDRHELESLLNRVRSKDNGAVDDLLAKIRPYLQLVARQQLRSDQRHQISGSDVAQESLLRVSAALKSPFAAAGTFHGGQAPEFLAWARQLVRNVIIDMDRRNRARKRDQRRTVRGSEILSELAKGTPPEQRAEDAERSMRVATALEKLPENQRRLIERRVFDGDSYGKISKETGKTEASLRIAFLRALRRLQNADEIRPLLDEHS